MRRTAVIRFAYFRRSLWLFASLLVLIRHINGLICICIVKLRQVVLCCANKLSLLLYFSHFSPRSSVEITEYGKYSFETYRKATYSQLNLNFIAVYSFIILLCTVGVDTHEFLRRLIAKEFPVLCKYRKLVQTE